MAWSLRDKTQFTCYWQASGLNAGDCVLPIWRGLRMPEIKNVLFPVDFSLHCRGVAPFVRALTGHFRAHLTLIHGIAIPPEYYVTYGVNVSAALRTELRGSSTASLQAFADQEFGSASVQRVIEEGDAAEVSRLRSETKDRPDHDADARLRATASFSARLSNGEGAPRCTVPGMDVGSHRRAFAAP